MTPRARLILMVPLVAALVGCEGGRSAVPLVGFTDDGTHVPAPVGPGLVADPDSPIPDVPMPIGFEPVPSKSGSSFDGRARTVLHVYQGRGTIAEAAQFYRQQLRGYGWSFTGRSDDTDGATVLNFEKGPERLRVRLTQRRIITTITVNIAPRPAAR